VIETLATTEIFGTNDLYNTLLRGFTGDDTPQQEETLLIEEEVASPAPDVCLISLLPSDVSLHIFSYVDIFSLIYRAAVVCQPWHELCNNDVFWKSRYMASVRDWHSFQSHHMPKSSLGHILKTTSEFYGKLFGSAPVEISSNTPPQTPSLTWKQKYLLQYSRNSAEYTRHVALRTCPVSNHQANLNPKGLQFSPTFSSTYKVLIVGEGMETSAKRLVYDMMWGERTIFKMTKLYPGNEGIGSGVGFEVNGVDLNVSAIYNHAKALMRTDDQEKWVDLFRESHALLFVMDLFGSTDSVKNELDLLLRPELGFRPQAPLLVLACKHSMSRETSTNPDTGNWQSPAEIAEKLKLHELARPWCVRHVEVQTLDGIYQGLDWLIPIL